MAFSNTLQWLQLNSISPASECLRHDLTVFQKANKQTTSGTCAEYGDCKCYITTVNCDTVGHAASGKRGCDQVPSRTEHDYAPGDQPTIDRFPFSIIQLRYIWDGRSLICREIVAPIEQPHEPTLHDQESPGVNATIHCRTPVQHGKHITPGTQCMPGETSGCMHHYRSTRYSNREAISADIAVTDSKPTG